MQRKRGLTPVAEALADLPGAVQALRETPPPARRGFTQADQVNQLVSASEAEADLGFMGWLMALCPLPRTNPGNRKEYVRRNGPYTFSHECWWALTSSPQGRGNAEGMPRCFMIQPFDGGQYDKRYEDVFEPAIRAAGLEPYR